MFKKKQIPYRLKTYITLRDKGICQICGKKGKIKSRFGCYKLAYEHNGTTFDIAHIFPEFWGGEIIAENLLLLCRRCNRSIGINALPKHSLD